MGNVVKLALAPPKRIEDAPQYVPASTKDRARAIAIARHDAWDDAQAKGRACCFLCGVLAMSVAAAPRGVLLYRHECRLPRGDDSLVKAATAAGFECGPGAPGRLNLSGPKPLPRASADSVTSLTEGERRVLAFVAKQTDAGEWFVVTYRQIVEACHVSVRHAGARLQGLADHGLLKVQSNNRRRKRPTKIAFLADPADLSQRLAGRETPTTKKGNTDGPQGNTNPKKGKH
jgi:hypothetical protein